jgi:predicted enzyme related to lactoylglutathione lyase
MADANAGANKPVWVDLSSSDAAGSREFYAKLFGWNVEVNPDPQYGGYALAKVDGKDVAGIGPKQSPDAPTAWMIYIGTHDAQDLASKVQTAGGAVIAPPFEVGEQGQMAVFQDNIGAFISAWQPRAMGGFQTNAPNTFGWAELNARGIDRAVPFYRQVFGWTDKKSEMGEGAPPYTEFQVGGESIAGGMEMNPMVPAEVPSYWMVYFNVDDVDRSFTKATEAGGREMLAPQDFPGGRFAILSDPQGAAFGILKMRDR